MFAVIETHHYRRAIDRLGIGEEEAFEILKTLSENPRIGVLIPGTGGARKWRVPLAGRGKSGGGRVISYFAGEDTPVWLLDIFSKGEKVNLSPREKVMLKDELERLAAEYRSGVLERLRILGERRHD